MLLLLDVAGIIALSSFKIGSSRSSGLVVLGTVFRDKVDFGMYLRCDPDWRGRL